MVNSIFAREIETEKIDETMPLVLSQEEAEEVSINTLLNIQRQGYCLWKCSALNGDIIMVIDGPISENVVILYPVYTLEELDLLMKLDDSTIRLVHLTKKLGGSELISVEEIVKK